MSQPWPDHYRDQEAYIRDLERRLNILLDKSEVVTLIQNNTPNRADMAAAWSLRKGRTIQIPPYGKTQWFDPETRQIDNLYVYLPEHSLNPFGIQGEALTLPSVEMIGQYVMKQGDTAVASTTFSWTKTYRAIFIHWSLRSTVAALASTFQIQPNALTGSIYSHAASKIDQTPQATFEANYNYGNGWSVASIPGGNAPNPHIFGQGQGMIYFPDVTVQAKSGFFDALHITNDASGATEFRYNKGSWHVNTLQAITSLRFVPQGNFAVGSKIVVMGIHPQS